MIDRIAALRALLGGPRDDARLRFALGSELLDSGDADAAVTQLRAALERKPDFSAAWKLLGRACLANGDTVGAADAWRQGIAVAEAHGEVQAAKTMQVFLQRLAHPR